MNVLLVSQCDKRALTETRRILDQFAERRGDRTWQTPITKDGLDTLRRLLRKTARKNTAVACHWIRGLDNSELLWTVGNASGFNAQGAVPTNTTARNVLRREGENDWHTGEDIHLLAALAALLHDLGKACKAFQDRLRGKGAMERNLYRHEWVSLRLFQAFVGTSTDEEWLQRLATPTAKDDASWLDLERLFRDGLDPRATPPFPALPAMAQAVCWLVLTHHRLPVMPAEEHGGPRWLGAKVPGFAVSDLGNILARVDASWNEQCTETASSLVAPYWHFPHCLPVTTDAWRKRAARLALRLQQLQRTAGKGNWLDNPYVMHIARLSLMLADHHYSSLTPQDKAKRVSVPPGYPLHANTCDGQLNQTLDEHLVGVAVHTGEICHALPGFEHHLPRLARHKGLKKRSDDPRFRWQDHAADLATGMARASATGGAFIVNMASTGCGKTLANARTMYALADPAHGMRCSFALGLRTLTLQTGRVYRDALHLGDDDLAIRVGGTASRQLFEYYEALAEKTGSSSAQQLLPDEDGHVYYEGNTDGHLLLQKAMRDPQVRRLLSAPVLACTIDHLTPATESQRGGRQIAPMLRLMSSDLVLDELDDFDIDDLPAVARLVHWAGMLGARVLISSATLPPAIVRGMFDAYRDGRALYARNRGGRPGQVLPICCAWIDEFHQVRQDCKNLEDFSQQHVEFVRRRHGELGKGMARRRAELLPLALAGLSREDGRRRFALHVRDAAVRLHQQHHDIDPVSQRRVSFGLVRMANIEPLYDVALALYALGAPDGMRIHLCVYHSQFPLLLRSAIERRLDAALDRKDEQAVFRLPDIRGRLDAHDEPDQLFVVLGSPVTEVGRDHSYNWAVVEPSSMRSLIQLAGRVERHRLRECTTPNMLLFDTNLRHWERLDQAAYRQPGFEEDNGAFRLGNHDLAALLRPEERDVIDARPRIVPRVGDLLRPQASLVDLEHARVQRTMAPPPPGPPISAQRQRLGARAVGLAELGAFHWWHLPRADALLTAVLPQQQPFRADTQQRIELCLLPDDETETYLLNYVAEQKRGPSLYVEIDRSRHEPVPLEGLKGPRIQSWGAVDYMEELNVLATELNLPLDVCAKRFGTVTLPEHDRGWRFHAALGFAKRK